MREKVIAMLMDGVTPAEVARQVSTSRHPVTRAAVCAFRKRHAEELQPIIEQVEKQITDAAIADKVQRILDADADYKRLGDIIAARATDKRYEEPGYSSGLMTHTLRQIGTGRNAEVVDEYKVDTALVAERRALRREVAEALGQLPKPQVNIDNRSLTVFSIKVDDGNDRDS